MKKSLEMKKYKVYVHTCPNGKRYVGCTTQKVNERWHRGRSYSGIFRQDILKYGWDNITHDVFEVDSKEEMYRKEVELISFYHSNDPEYGYNTQSGGVRGFQYNKEHLDKITERAREVHSRPGYRERVAAGKKGKSIPHAYFLWRFPDGTVKKLTKQNASKLYINRGIPLEKL